MGILAYYSWIQVENSQSVPPHISRGAPADGHGPQEPIPKESGLGVQKVRQSVHVGEKILYLVICLCAQSKEHDRRTYLSCSCVPSGNPRAITPISWTDFGRHTDRLTHGAIFTCIPQIGA